jgi:tripartite-type tricarboxylate transporter receptor subunit TctC
MHHTRRFLILGVIVSSALAASLPSAAQQPSWPAKPIRLLVAFPPGGGGDVTARLVANKLGNALGQPVLVENRPGAGGTVGTAEAARAAPDGHTLLLGSASTISIAPHVYTKLTYRPRRDFVPVTLVQQGSQLLAVNPSVPAKDLETLVEVLKASNGSFNYASYGTGTSSHLAMEMFKRAAGVEINHVPYKGSGPAVTDLIGGQIPVGMSTFEGIDPHVRTGKLRALAITSPVRSTLAPDVPTFAELGYPALTLSPWYGVFAPAGTPDAVVQKLAAEIRNVVDTPDTRAQFAQLGAEVMLLDGQDARTFLAKDDAHWAEAARLSGAVLD